MASPSVGPKRAVAGAAALGAPAMEFSFNRQGGVAVRQQLVAQLEMKILEGVIAPGAKLPSVRAFARRLRLHPNTVSAAYRDLQDAGHVVLRRGSGVYVLGPDPLRIEDAQTLDQMIRAALALARRKGFSGLEVRQAVERWLATAPVDHLLVTDRSREMAELLAHELRAGLGVSPCCAALAELQADPGLLRGALAVTLAWHVAEVRRIAPTADVEVVTLEMSDEERTALGTLNAGSILLVVSHAPTVLPYARKLISSLRGDELLVEAHPLGARGAWQRVAPVADLAFADALAAPALRRAGARRVHEIRLVRDEALTRLRARLTSAVPQAPAPARRRGSSVESAPRSPSARAR